MTICGIVKLTTLRYSQNDYENLFLDLVPEKPI